MNEEELRNLARPLISLFTMPLASVRPVLPGNYPGSCTHLFVGRLAV
jgi:hypothetical protein